MSDLSPSPTEPSPSLQLIYGLLGFLILTLGFVPSVKLYLSDPHTPPGTEATGGG